MNNVTVFCLRIEDAFDIIRGIIVDNAPLARCGITPVKGLDFNGEDIVIYELHYSLFVNPTDEIPF